jgi:hypothetical protein
MRKAESSDHALLVEIRNMLRLVLKGEGNIMADIDTLNSLIAGLGTDFDALGADLTAAQQAAKNNQPVDLSGAIAKLQALKDKADAATQAVNAPAPAPTDGSVAPAAPSDGSASGAPSAPSA